MNTTTNTQPALTGITTEVQITMEGFDSNFANWAGDYADDYDVEAIRDEYNAELADRAPEGVSWGWVKDGPFIFADIALDHDEVREAFDKAIDLDEGGIDLAPIAQKHELPTMRLVWVAGPIDSLQVEELGEDGDWIFVTGTEIGLTEDSDEDEIAAHEAAMRETRPGKYVETITYW